LDKVKFLEHLAVTDDRRNGAVGVVTRLRLAMTDDRRNGAVGVVTRLRLAMTDDRRNGAVGVVTRLRLSRQRKCALIPVVATDFSLKLLDWFWESCHLLMNRQGYSACE